MRVSVTGGVGSTYDHTPAFIALADAKLPPRFPRSNIFPNS
jgi:hypothetical protein